ncbi:hypothetical protein ACGFY3_41325 [Streptomyces mirabilis]|uniref:hypothetical protein n=1 Tax=Streptomyces mirabilis TaxID=68239 RepID=UPI0037142977
MAVGCRSLGDSFTIKGASGGLALWLDARPTSRRSARLVLVVLVVLVVLLVFLVRELWM